MLSTNEVKGTAKILGFILIHTGEYHHYDFFVYPSVMKVPKTFFDQVRDSTIMNALFGKRNPEGSANEVDLKILSTEEMSKQCLNFYLEPYMKQLMDGKYSETFKVDDFVKRVTSVYLQHKSLSIKCNHHPSHCTVEGIPKVKHIC